MNQMSPRIVGHGLHSRYMIVCDALLLGVTFIGCGLVGCFQTFSAMLFLTPSYGSSVCINHVAVIAVFGFFAWLSPVSLCMCDVVTCYVFMFKRVIGVDYSIECLAEK
jgi:hypothetical protein